MHTCLLLITLLLLSVMQHVTAQGEEPSGMIDVIGQAIQAAVQDVQNNNVRKAQRDGLAGTTRTNEVEIAPAAFSAAFRAESSPGVASPSVPLSTDGSPTAASPFSSSLWHHSRFSRGFDPRRVAQMAQSAEICLAAEQNFNAATGSVPGTIASSPMLLSAFRQQIVPFCPLSAPPPECNPNARYRTADGTCNNLANPLWGSSFRAHRRFLPPDYEDGLNAPRTQSVLGGPLPSAREVSNVVHNIGQCTDQSHLAIMFMVFGQFRDHDYTSTPVVRGPNNEVISCCPDVPSNPEACFPIRVPPGDPRGTQCMTFVRSAPASEPPCDPGPRQQTNQLTSYLDASSVYGSDQAEQDDLREFSGGLLIVSPGDLLPPDNVPGSCILQDTNSFCFKAGDKRNTEIITLTPSHITFHREHNRIARNLQILNPHWDDERLFQESRKLVSAILQHITYNEYVPIMLGKKQAKAYGLCPSKKGFRNVYSKFVDATVANSFATAAFRYGHSQIPKKVRRLNKDYNIVDNVPLETQFDRPRFMFTLNGVEDTTRFEITERQSREDRRLENSVREFLFIDETGDSFDLASLNIQRGRDHGLPSYNKWRKWCGLQPSLHFGGGTLGLQNHNAESRNLLQQAYRHPDDIDLFTGGLSEERIPGSLVGPTFSCLLGRQFSNSQRGDRFYYENNFPLTGFSLKQLNEIKKIRLSSVLCANVNLGLAQADVFRPPSPRNPLLPCSKFPQINFIHWRE